jgi:hypothetical protein
LRLNDDRLDRALDALYHHLEAVWTEIVSQALLRYQINISIIASFKPLIKRQWAKQGFPIFNESAGRGFSSGACIL